MLGPNTPLMELPSVTERAAIQAIVLSGSAKTAPIVIEEELLKLCQTVKIPVFLGGRVTDRYSVVINANGAIALDADLSLALCRIDATLMSRR